MLETIDAQFDSPHSASVAIALHVQQTGDELDVAVAPVPVRLHISTNADHLEELHETPVEFTDLARSRTSFVSPNTW